MAWTIKSIDPVFSPTGGYSLRNCLIFRKGSKPPINKLRDVNAPG
jgi:hypothetical protein